MNASPLAPFLASLAADGFTLRLRDYQRIRLVLSSGGPWTLERLREVLAALLAKDADQQEIFLRRFDSFFNRDPRIGAGFAEIDLERALEDLRRLETERPPEPESPRSPPPISAEERKRSRRIWAGIAVAAALFVLTVSWFFLNLGDLLLDVFFPIPVIEPYEVAIPPPPVPVPSSPCPEPLTGLGLGWVCPGDEPLERNRLYRNALRVASVQSAPKTADLSWAAPAGFAFLSLLVAFSYAGYLWRSRRIPEDKPPDWNPEAARHFPLGKIGGKPAPRLSATVLNALADSMSYFQSPETRKSLDVDASIEATSRNGGIPALRYRKEKKLRTLLVLEDAFAQPLAWNGVARELADGMRRRGVPVVRARFHGSLKRFTTSDGQTLRLEDLEDDRHGHLVLVFSDGKSLTHRDDRFALEALSHWPMVAWMELREPRFWDEGAALPTRYGIPLYPATEPGLLRALGRFLAERGARRDFSDQTFHRRPPTLVTGSLDAAVEEILGDALLWAQACSMLQPMSLGLADALRREFHGHLPAERIERLLQLPETLHNVSGIRFSDPVLAVLRRGFAIRRTEDEQERVLRFLLQQIEAAEPEEEEGLAHLAWQWTLEKVRLELEPDRALKRLSELAATPLGNAIRAELESTALKPDREQVPLRVHPQDQDSLQRLARLADNAGVRKLDAYPVAWGHRVALGSIGVAFLAFSAWSVLSASRGLGEQRIEFEVAEGQQVAVALERQDGADWKLVSSAAAALSGSDAVTAHGRYRLAGLNDGDWAYQEVDVGGDDWKVVFELSDAQRPCHEELGPGVTIQRCPEGWLGGHSWRPILLKSPQESNDIFQLPNWRAKLAHQAPEGRMLSVGLEIYRPTDARADVSRLLDDFFKDGAVSLLLSTSSVDLIYRVRPGPDGELNLETALPQIRRHLGPWAQWAQLIWWWPGSGRLGRLRKEEYSLLADFLGDFQRTLGLGGAVDIMRIEPLNYPGSWPADLARLLEGGGDALLPEDEIKNSIRPVSLSGDGAPVVLMRRSIEVQIPDCVGRLLADCEEILARAVGVELGNVTRRTENGPEGVVLAQNPAAGAQVPWDASLDVVVSAAIDFPDCVGRTVESCRQLLADADLKLGNVNAQESDAPQDQVIEQVPQPGAGTLDVVVSIGQAARARWGRVDDMVGAPGRYRSREAFWEDLKIGDEILIGDHLRIGTGNKLALRRGAAGGFEIGQNADVNLLRESTLRLSHGSVKTFPADRGGEPLTVETPWARATGHNYAVSCDVGEGGCLFVKYSPRLDATVTLSNGNQIRLEPEFSIVVRGGEVAAPQRMPREQFLQLLIDVSLPSRSPDCVGESLSDCELAAALAGIPIGEVEETLSERTRGTVISQIPKPDEPLSPRDSLDLTISAGSEPPTDASSDFPAVAGLAEVAAVSGSVRMQRQGEAWETVRFGTRLGPGDLVQTLAGSSLEVVLESGDRLTLAPETQVVVDTPKWRFLRGSARLTVRTSGDDTPVRVPNLGGMLLDEAEKTLDSIGLKASVTRRKECQVDGIVLQQSPQAGSEMSPASEVNLVVADASLLLRLSDGVCIEFVDIAAGRFRMGSDKEDPNAEPDEMPSRTVVITKDFQLGKYEVTQAQWEAVMGENPSAFKGGDRPVERVSWDDVQQFIQRFNARNDGHRYRLPTEAEWEYAARAGTTGDYAGNLDEMAWHRGNSDSRTHPVGLKKPNSWGLYDMHGNVWEWVNDWYGESYYADRPDPDRDPQGPNSGVSPVMRGGGWLDSALVSRSAFRYRAGAEHKSGSVGFRLLRVPR